MKRITALQRQEALRLLGSRKPSDDFLHHFLGWIEKQVELEPNRPVGTVFAEFIRMNNSQISRFPLRKS